MKTCKTNNRDLNRDLIIGNQVHFRGVSRTLLKISDGSQLLVVNYFRKKNAIIDI